MIVSTAKGDTGQVETPEPAVRHRATVRLVRQIGEHRFGASKRWLALSHLALPPDHGRVLPESMSVGEMREAVVEREAPSLMQRHRPSQKQATKQVSHNVCAALASPAHPRNNTRTVSGPG